MLRSAVSCACHAQLNSLDPNITIVTAPLQGNASDSRLLDTQPSYSYGMMKAGTNLYWFSQWVVDYRQVGMNIVIVPSLSPSQNTSTDNATSWLCRGKCNCGGSSMVTTVAPAPSSRDCCLYANSDVPPIINAFCVDDSEGCPSIPAWTLYGYFPVASCALCAFVPPELGM